MSKYNSRKITIDGICFDSKVEARYYEHLKDLKSAGKISAYEMQPRFELVPKFTYQGKNRRKTEYVADFLVYHLDGSQEVVDIKGQATETALMKRKLFEYKYPLMHLSWICQSYKYGDEDGWIDYDELKAKRREAKNV